MNYNSIYMGYVESVDDPEKLGRIKVRVPCIHGRLTYDQISLLPWARYISPNTTGMKRTSFILPKIHDMVYVVFQGGDKQYPLYFGSSFGKPNGISEVPITDEDDYYDTDVIYSSGLHGAIIKRNPKGFEISYKDTSVKFDNEGNLYITVPNKIYINEEIVYKTSNL